MSNYDSHDIVAFHKNSLKKPAHISKCIAVLQRTR